MEYIKTTFAPGDILSSAYMNKLENTMVEVTTAITELKNAEGELVTKSEQGTTFRLTDAKSVIDVSANSATTIYSAQKNLFPHLEQVVVGGALKSNSSVTFDGNSFTCVVKSGETYKNLIFGPIYFPPGSYVVHREKEILSGAATGNIGWVYIHKTDKDGSTIQANFSAIYSSATDIQFTFTEDTWLKFDVYGNMNGTVTEDATIKLFNFSITEETSFSGFEDWKGTIIKGTSGTLPFLIPYTKIYCSDEINISYKVVGSSLEDIQPRIDDCVTAIAKLQGDGKTVVCWGDSLTDGTGSTNNKPASETNSDCSYPAVLGRLITDGTTVLNAGVGGETSWMIAARQGGAFVQCLPTTIPASIEKVRIYIKGEEQDYFYTNGRWTYLENNLSYNISTGNKSMVNPVTIAGVSGTLSAETITEGTPDNETGETVQTQVRAYYFTRAKAGQAVSFTTPRSIITNAYCTMQGYIPVIWMGQNDAPNHSGSYITQGDAIKRAQQMLQIIPHKKYIIMDYPSGSNSSAAARAQDFANAFGAHYINIRKYICDYGVDYANSLGAEIVPEESDTSSVQAGTIPSCLRIDGVHGNYWYYQIVAKAVFDRGVDLGYWS